MKILQINAVYKKASTGRNVAELNEALEAAGHQALVAFSTGVVEVPQQEYLIGGILGQKLHALFSRLSGMQGYYSSHATRKLLRHIDRQAPDVVVLNNLHANYVHLPKLLNHLAKRDIATVAVLHDCWFYTGKCCYYSAADCEKWKTRCGDCPIIREHNKSWFFDFTEKMHRDRERLFRSIPRLGVIAVSDWLYGQAIQSPVFQNALQITRIYNWIDTQVFHPAPTAALKTRLGLEGKKIFLSVAMIWEPRKGLETLKKIAQKLAADEIIIAIGRMQKDTSLPENIIHIPGTESQEELVQYYSMADVFLQPSQEETFGKVTAEALACGTPVVCYDSAANPELVGPGCGTVVPVGAWETMLEKARAVLKQGKPAYSTACREYALKTFDTNRIFQEYLGVFVSLQSQQCGVIKEDIK